MTKKKHKNAIISHPKFGGGGKQPRLVFLTWSWRFR